MTHAATITENRKEPRRRTFMGGRIVCPANSTTYDCRIRDLSVGGAKLEIDQWYTFPKNLIVEVGKLELIEARYEAEVRWTNAKHLGVQFVRKIEDGEKLKLQSSGTY